MKSGQNNRAYIQAVDTLKKEDYQELIEIAIKEDCIENDVSTRAIFPESKNIRAILVSKDNGVLCGTRVFSDVFLRIDHLLNPEFYFTDGSTLRPGDTVAEIHGNVQNILRAERIALNFISFMSGIATRSSQAVEILKPFGIVPLDTRKTIPGYRILSKYAVYTGGAMNHRVNLQEMGLIKDNHIAAAGSVKNAIQMFRKACPEIKCEVEVENIDQLNEALAEKPDMILLDNMSADLLKKCAAIINTFNTANRTQITSEASGGFNIKNIHLLADTGVDYASMGSLTNNIQPFDFSLEVGNYQFRP